MARLSLSSCIYLRSRYHKASQYMDVHLFTRVIYILSGNHGFLSLQNPLLLSLIRILLQITPYVICLHRIELSLQNNPDLFAAKQFVPQILTAAVPALLRMHTEGKM